MALHGTGRTRQPLREMQHNPQRSHVDGLTGVGLSSRLKTGQGPGAPAAFVPTVRPRGRRLPLYAPLPEYSLTLIQSHKDLLFHCLVQHRPCSMGWVTTSIQPFDGQRVVHCTHSNLLL